MEAHTIVHLKVLARYASDVQDQFPCMPGDKLVEKRREPDGSVTLIYEVAAPELRLQQRYYIAQTHALMQQRLPALRLQLGRRRGYTLFAYKTSRIDQPRHDDTLLNRVSWKETILAQSR